VSWPGWEKFAPPVGLGAGQLKRKAKYGAEPTEVDGITFASRREANRYVALKIEQAAGVVTDLELQPQFPLSVITLDGTKVIIGRYIADFRYRRNGVLVVEDAKGMKTDLYRWKRKHVEAEHGITVLET
jgi:hypothetical protein